MEDIVEAWQVLQMLNKMIKPNDYFGFFYALTLLMPFNYEHFLRAQTNYAFLFSDFAINYPAWTWQ